MGGLLGHPKRYGDSNTLAPRLQEFCAKLISLLSYASGQMSERPRHQRRAHGGLARHRAAGLISNFTSDVYWWEPDGRVVRLSPGDGIYSMACVHPDGDHAV